MRIVSINTGRNAGDYPVRISVLARRIRALNPDIVLAQEVFATADGRFDTAAVIAAEGEFQYASAPARPKLREVAGQPLMSTSGLALFSRFPIQQGTAIALPTSEADGGRVMQVVEVNVQGTPLRLVNLHLSFIGGADGDRLRGVQWREVETAIAASDLPTVIAGDFNATPSSPLLRGLMSDRKFDFGPDDLETSLPTSFGGLIDAGGGGEVLDYIVAVRPGVRLRRRRVELTAVEAELGSCVSDHAAVVAEVDIVSCGADDLSGKR